MSGMSKIINHIRSETHGMYNRELHESRLIKKAFLEIESLNPDIIDDILSAIDADIESNYEAQEKINHENRCRLYAAARSVS